MSIPLSFLDHSSLPEGPSLGEFIGDRLSASYIQSLADCLCSGPNPAIYSPDTSRPPLLRDELQEFVSNFVLPRSSNRTPLGRNDRVMVVLPSGPENALALLALGNYHSCAPVNAGCTISELKEDVVRLNAKAIITTKNVAKRLELQPLQDKFNCEIIYVHPRLSGPAGLFDMSLPDTATIILPSHPSKPHGLDDISFILHTSGTGGKKKVVRYSLRKLLVGTSCVIHSWGLRPSDLNLNVMPLLHVGGIVRNLLAPIFSGGSAIMCAEFDPNVFWSLAKDLHATWYYASPIVHHAVLSSRPDSIIPSKDLSMRLICSAAGGLSPSLASELKDIFGAVVLPSYGMAECMPIATPRTDYQLDCPGCSGIACGPHLSIRQVNDIESEVAIGQTGAVCVRGLPTFDGYEVSSDLSVPLDTSAFSKEGWFDSGDMGHMDEDGYLYITGRSKEIINKGGEVISPFEVEEAIVAAAKEYVKTVLAFSIEHDVLQEVIGVVIVPDSTRPRISLHQLHGLLKDRLHPSKWPFAVVYMDGIPKNSAGKPLRITLSKRLGIGQLTDNCPPLRRHFDAALPVDHHLLSEPIPCSEVTINTRNIEQALKRVPNVEDVALRHRSDGSVDAYISLRHGVVLMSSEVVQILSRDISGYELPAHVYLILDPLLRDTSGNYDYDAMEKVLLHNMAVNLSKRQLLVRDIMAEILNVDPSHIQKDSDFFMLGGNSLLVGKLAYHLHRQSNVKVEVAELFAESTIEGIATLIEEKEFLDVPGTAAAMPRLATNSSPITPFSREYNYELDLEYSQSKAFRGQDHPLCLVVQAIPFICFYPLKAALTWTMLLFMLSYLGALALGNFWDRMIALLTAILVARLVARILCPLTAIIFKWIVIGRYQPGLHRMWSPYYLRWWIVNQSLRIAGQGIFSMHPSLVILYYRLLGANIGSNVYIDPLTRLYECDLITLQDGCRIDASSLRGFCVEREGHFRLGPINVGRRAFVNTYTYISPGTNIADGLVYGPHASSHDSPSPKSYAAFNRTLQKQPSLAVRIFIAWPIIGLVIFISYIPWMAAIFAMVHQTHFTHKGLNDLETVIYWFSSPQRILYHAVSKIVRALFRPLIQLVLGILVKRLLGLNTENTQLSVTQRALLRRYVNGILLSREDLKQAFSILGTHYEIVSIVYRAMGAKVGRRVYWPGSGIYCPDPELLEIGDDVVFGSRSALITTDRLGSGKVVVESGAMIADRVVLLPNTNVGRRAVMGSGALGRRGGGYEDGSTWIGNDKGEAVCLNKGSKETSNENPDTTTPFGRAFYKRQADYFVFPYLLILFIGMLVTTLSASYWSISAVAAAQMLRHAQIHYRHFKMFDARWYRLVIIYGLIACCFMVTITAQGVLSIFWTIISKWIIIGRRHPGLYDWDQSSYCQRWQLHLVLSPIVDKGYGLDGVLGPLSGTAYLVWYLRAMGAHIGKNCAIWAGGRRGLMTEPDLVELGDNVNLDECSVVAHLNSRGRFSLNHLKIGNQCAMRAGSRLLSGASMEDNSMLCEHTLLTSGDVADADQAYAGWPAKILAQDSVSNSNKISTSSSVAPLTCPICCRFPKDGTVSECGHLFCEACIVRALSKRKYCPICYKPSTPSLLKRVHLSFSTGQKMPASG